LGVLGNRNFSLGTLLTALYGFVLYGITSMLPLFLQTLMGYPALDSGLAVSPRGLGCMLSMFVVGPLVNYVDGRLLLAFGFSIVGSSVLMLSHVNLQIAMSSVALPNFINGFGSGFVFVPLITMTMSRLRKEEMGNAAGIFNLMRNIGGSVGIACVTTFLVRGSQVHQRYLVANVTAGNPIVMKMIHGLEAKLFVGGAGAYTAHHKALGMFYGAVQRQASLLAYMDNFRMLGFLSLLCIPLALCLRKVRKQPHERPDISGE
jgi:DHA2 family multidrug resistance protein